MSNYRPSLGPLALLPLILSGCGSASSGTDDSYRFDLPPAAVRAQVLKLADCPSPLARLKIAAPARRIAQTDLDTITLTVRANDSAAVIVLRFRLQSVGEQGKPITLLRLHLSVPDAAKELELGEGQLLTPLAFTKQLGEALKTYFELGDGHDTARPFDNTAKLAAQCNKIGRLLDDGAVLISPALAETLHRQRKRDALNWLFKDNYKLRTNGKNGVNWDFGSDYNY